MNFAYNKVSRVESAEPRQKSIVVLLTMNRR
jgi:hypothetical protein